MRKQLMANLMFVTAPLAAMALLAAVALQPLSPDRAAAQQGGICPANPSPPDAADPSIIVDRPAAGGTIQSPVTISGKARTFEANVQVRILDADGDVIKDTFTMADEGAPALAPFSAAVSFNVPSKQGGCVMVFEGSAQDGRPINVVLVPVVLAASAAPGPPDTGNAGLMPEPADDGADSPRIVVGLAAVAAGLAMMASMARRRVGRR